MSDGVDTIPGKRVLVKFEGKKCIHSRGCVLSRPDVFVPNVEGEWIHPDAATPDEIVELAHNCPSGAIRYQRLDGGPEESPPKVNLVRVRENGPVSVYAELKLAGAADPGMRLTLCRCGLSKNKPYCDSSHHGDAQNAPFVASGEAPTQQSADLPARDGVLSVTPAKNGPLLLSGNVEVVTGTGRTIVKTTKTALCRCGHSANKPFCDGTHAKVGFVSELASTDNSWTSPSTWW